MNNYFFNFSPISSGGGLQNSLSFLEQLLAEELSDFIDTKVICRNSSPIHDLVKGKLDVKVLESRGALSRILDELRIVRTQDTGRLCFTMFGPPLFGSAGKLNNVVGCAYSNLFYPEVPFWSYLNGPSLLKKKLIDNFRRRQTAHADYWIFETEALKKRAVELCHFPEERVGVVRMAASTLVSPDRVLKEKADYFHSKLPVGKVKLLHLCGAHPNKRLHLLPEISKKMVMSGFNDFCFVTTFDDENLYGLKVLNEFRNKGLEEHLVNLGPVKPEEVASLIEQIDVMCTFSLLESFSNNFIEAWKMKKPLVVTDGDWSRDSCGDGAKYLDFSDLNSVVANLVELCKNDFLRESLVSAGSAQLLSYPTAQEKFKLYLEEIKKAQILGPCPKSLKKKITWPKPRYK